MKLLFFIVNITMTRACITIFRMSSPVNSACHFEWCRFSKYTTICDDRDVVPIAIVGWWLMTLLSLYILSLNFIVDIKWFMSNCVELVAKMNSLKKLLLKILKCIYYIYIISCIIFLQIFFLTCMSYMPNILLECNLWISY